MARERGTDVRSTAKDVCLIVDKTDQVAFLIGGRGETECMVDALLDQGHQLREIKYKGNEQFYNVILHRGMEMAGLSIPMTGIDSVVYIPNKANYLDLRLYKPGVPKPNTRLEFGGELALRNLEGE